MKKINLISTLLIASLLLSGCNKQTENPTTPSDITPITTPPVEVVTPSITVPVTKEPSYTATPTSIATEGLKPNSSDIIEDSILEQLSSGKPVEIPNPYSFNLGYDDVLDQISCEFIPNSIYPFEYDSYTLTVNDSSVTESLTVYSDKLYLMYLDSDRYLIIVHEVGYSNDDILHLFLYDDRELMHLGNIPGGPEQCHSNPDGSLTSCVRGNLLHTWFYDADFIISNYYYNYDDNSQYLTPKIVQMPNKMYPMGTQVILKADLPLYATTDSVTLSGIIPKGSSAILVACDDIQWLYIDSIDTIEGEHIRGYVKFADRFSFWINDKQVSANDIFDGLCYAD